MTLLTIDGVAMPAPTTYEPSFADIDSSNSGRNDLGVMTRDVVRKDVFNLSVEWSYLTTEELNTIIEAIKNKNSMTLGFFFGTSELQTRTVYYGDRSLQLVTPANDPRWSLSIKFIEY